MIASVVDEGSTVLVASPGGLRRPVVGQAVGQGRLSRVVVLAARLARGVAELVMVALAVFAVAMAAVLVLRAVLVLGVLGAALALVRHRAVRRRAAVLTGLRALGRAGTRRERAVKRRAAALLRAEQRLATQARECATDPKTKGATATVCAVYTQAELCERVGDWEGVAQVLAAELPLMSPGVRGTYLQALRCGRATSVVLGALTQGWLAGPRV